MLHRKILILSISVLIMFIFGCIDTPKEPVAPSWDVELNLPIGSKKVTIEDIAERQEQIEITNSKILKFSTDTIQKDTTLEFLFNNTFDMEADTSFPVIGTTVEFNMIAGRDSVRMDSAEIQEGVVSYRMTNNNNSSVQVSFVFPGFTRVNGGVIDTFQISANVPANQTVQVNVQLNDYKYKQPPNQPFGSTRPGIWIKAKVSSSLIGIGQNLSVNIKVKDIKFRKFAGRVRPFDLGSKSQSIENNLSGELKDFVSAVTFTNAILTLRSTTTITGYDILIKDFQIRGKFKNGTSPIYLQFNGNNKKDLRIPAGSSITDTFSTANTNINQFIKSTPDSIEIIGKIIINPDYKVGSVSQSDKISFSALFEAYSQMRIENAIITDTAEVDWEQETKDKLSQGNEANLVMELTNAMPIDIQLIGYFMDSNKNKLFYFTRQSGTGSASDTVINISAGNIDSDGKVASPSKSTINFKLNKSDFEKFKNVKYTVFRFKISSAQNQNILLKADDYVNVRLRGRINYRVK